MIRALKRFIRARDVKFAFGSGKKGERQSLRWKRHFITYRSGTSDHKHIERLLLLGKRCEYNLPRNIDSKFILDAGGNIGLATLFFAEYFPEATIVCCEPSLENLELLKLNTAHLPNVKVLHCALGGKSSVGYIVQQNTSDHANVKVTAANDGNIAIYDYADLLKVSGVPYFDLIKIDIEGSEYDFLSSLSDDQLARCKWIVGEVHGIDEWRLLDLLSRRFAIDIRKTMGDKPSKFHACNRANMEELLRGFDISILQK
jgi:FkbM family methyltransferase